MNLHEYQAKQLFRTHGIPVPEGQVVGEADDHAAIIDKLMKGGEPLVVKAQVHAGGRGKAGGVALERTVKDALAKVKALLGSRLVTYQTDAHGQPVHQILLEQPCAIARELYLGAVVDRAKQAVVFMASLQGGVEIEKVAKEDPSALVSIEIDPMLGLMPYQVRYLARALQLNKEQGGAFGRLLKQLSILFKTHDLNLLEINPLVVTESGELVCLDGKVSIDANALYRQPKLLAMRDLTQEDMREQEAAEWHLSYIALEGQIGCMVNGAGLAMATMDLIKRLGGAPANFLDVGGTADEARVAQAFKIILQDEQVRGIWINIFGGIVRCDLIADGIIQAVSQQDVRVPVVVRLVGNRAPEAIEKLEKSGLNVIGITDFSKAAQRIVDEVKAVQTGGAR